MGGDSHGASAKRLDWFLLALLALSLAANVGLTYAFIRLGSVSTTTPNPEVLRLGMAVPSLTVETPEGDEQTIRFDEDLRPTLLYVFAPECKWCERNLPNVRSLMGLSKTGKIRLIGLSLSGDVVEYARRHQLTFPMYVNPSPETIRAYGLGSTPETFVIQRGTLQKHWRGAFVGQSKADLEDWAGLKLPGIVREIQTSEASGSNEVGR